MLNGKTRAEAGVSRIGDAPDVPAEAGVKHIGDTGSASASGTNAAKGTRNEHLEITQPYELDKLPDDLEPTGILTGKRNDDGSDELRADTVVRDKPKSGQPRGVVNILKTKAKARKNINDGEGGTVRHAPQRAQARQDRQRTRRRGGVSLCSS